jgi:hypothetical protein
MPAGSPEGGYSKNVRHGQLVIPARPPSAYGFFAALGQLDVQPLLDGKYKNSAQRYSGWSCICHARGLRQGDPLSPPLFVLAMDVLNSLFKHTDNARLLTPLQPRVMKYRLFLYADDLVVFIAPVLQDVRVVRAVLQVFATWLGLRTNIAKCTITPIQCSDDDVAQVQQAFPCQVVHSPCKYLGVPLSVHQLRKEDLQPLADSVTDRLPSWKARLILRAGRTTLTPCWLFQCTCRSWFMSTPGSSGW